MTLFSLAPRFIIRVRVIVLLRFIEGKSLTILSSFRTWMLGLAGPCPSLLDPGSLWFTRTF